MRPAGSAGRFFMRAAMPNVTVRGASARDIPAITRIYAHAVLTGAASFEIEPPDEARARPRRRNEAVVRQSFAALWLAHDFFGEPGTHFAGTCVVRWT